MKVSIRHAVLLDELNSNRQEIVRGQFSVGANSGIPLLADLPGLFVHLLAKGAMCEQAHKALILAP